MNDWPTYAELLDIPPDDNHYVFKKIVGDKRVAVYVDHFGNLQASVRLIFAELDFGIYWTMVHDDAWCSDLAYNIENPWKGLCMTVVDRDKHFIESYMRNCLRQDFSRTARQLCVLLVPPHDDWKEMVEEVIFEEALRQGKSAAFLDNICVAKAIL